MKKMSNHKIMLYHACLHYRHNIFLLCHRLKLQRTKMYFNDHCCCYICVIVVCVVFRLQKVNFNCLVLSFTLSQLICFLLLCSWMTTNNRQSRRFFEITKTTNHTYFEKKFMEMFFKIGTTQQTHISFSRE